MKSTDKIAAAIAATEARLVSLKADLKAARKQEADAEQRALFCKIKSHGLSAADLDAFIASRQNGGQ